MISRFKPLFFRFLLLPLDGVIVIAVFLFSYFIRISDFFPFPVQSLLTSERYIPLTFVFALLFVFVHGLLGGYNLYRNDGIGQDIFKIAVSCFVWISIITSYFFWAREFFFSRFILMAALIGSFVFFIGARFLFYFGMKKFFPPERALIIGNEYPNIESMMKKIGNYSCEYKDVWDMKPNINALIVARHTDQKILDQYLHWCLIYHIHFYIYDPNILPHFIPHKVSGVQLYEFFNTPLYGWQIIAKRLIDVIGSVIAITVFSPFMIVIALAIKYETGGSVFYIGERVGYGSKLFKYFKFKSMRHKDAGNSKEHHLRYDESFRKECGDDPSQAIIKLKDDPRVTKVGKFLRRYSLDELAEFFNVLFGRMSLVGYRPHEAKEVEKMPEWYQKVLTVKPGITGLAQITSRDLDPVVEARLDLKYVENWSLWKDIKILFLTPLAMIRKRVKL